MHASRSRFLQLRALPLSERTTARSRLPVSPPSSQPSSNTRASHPRARQQNQRFPSRHPITAPKGLVIPARFRLLGLPATKASSRFQRFEDFGLRKDVLRAVDEVIGGTRARAEAKVAAAERRKESENSALDPNKADVTTAVEPRDDATQAKDDEELKLVSRPPTEIQKLAIPRLLRNLRRSQSVALIAAATGSGKTLAYAAPVVHWLKEEEKGFVDPDLDVDTLTRVGMDRSPRVLVLQPTAYLVEQTERVFKTFAHNVGLRVMAMNSERRWARAKMRQSPDIVISTPHRALVDGINLDQCRVMVVDEADTMFDVQQDFTKQLESLFSVALIENKTKTIVLSATIPKPVYQWLHGRFPEIQEMVASDIHRPVYKLKHTFLDVGADNVRREEGRGRRSAKYLAENQPDVDEVDSGEHDAQHLRNKHRMLLNVLKLNSKDRKTMIFTNTRHSCSLLNEFLKKTYPSFPIYVLMGELDAMKALDLSAFSTTGGILVATDMGSRGLDIENIDHVIMFDFPSNMIDYLHRSGRTARAGKRGKVTSLVSKKSRTLADAIRQLVIRRVSFA